MRSLLLSLAAAALLAVGAPAHATLTCSIAAVDSYYVDYDGQLPWNYTSSGTVTVACTRSAASDPTTVGFYVTSDDGLYALGTQNRARQRTGTTSSYLLYDFYTDISRTTNWGTKSTASLAGTLSMGVSAPSTQTAQMTYYAQIPSGQTGGPAGAYTDTVQLGLSYGDAAANPKLWTNVPAAAQIGVQINKVPSCVLSSPPGTVAFSYPAFSPTPVTASTTFAALCSTNHPYSVTLDNSTTGSVSGVISGLQYTLTLSATTGIGTGAAQFFTVNGVMPPSQAGDCSTGCTGSQTHTVTITY